ncbi:MAG: endolytic transglycosylase MltG [Clostridia bacterium]|nr:endolytic transglycosylase MltG [Clostridia bacterium]
MKYNETLEKARLAVQSLQPKSYKDRLSDKEADGSFGAASSNSESIGDRFNEFFDRAFRRKSGEKGTELEPSHAGHKDIAASAEVSANKAAEHHEESDAILADMNEYFDGKLSKEKERSLFSPRSSKPVSAKKLYSKKPTNAAVRLDPDDPEFDELHGHGYFKAEAEMREKADAKENFNKGVRIFWLVWSIIRIPLIIAASVFIVYTLLSKVGSKLYTKYVMPVDENDATPIVVTIEPGSGASEIAKVLYEACGEGEEGLITNKAVFKVYVDFIGKSNRLQAGTYVLSKNMSIPDIVDTICRGMPPREVKKLQVTEGMTIEAMAAKFVADGILSSPDRFLELCVTGEAFAQDHPFIKDIPDDETGERKYKLEGFLFPATYEIYVDATEETIIDKMLSRFGQIWGPIYTARAKAMGLSMYEVVTLASTVEKEARMKRDFARVSAVFNNRMAQNMMLESDATIEYVLKTGSLHLTEAQLATPSGYNTHINYGLPIGPVSNPGDDALSAVLYPDEEYLQDAFLYFCLKDPNIGELVFAKTLEEHLANVAMYSPLW